MKSSIRTKIQGSLYALGGAVVLGSIIPLALAQQNQTVPLRSIAVITPVPTTITKPVTPTAVEKSTIIIY